MIVPKPGLVSVADRRPCYVSLGAHVLGAAIPHPDQYDPWTALEGAVKRYAGKTPGVDPVMLSEAAALAEIMVEKFTPLDPGLDFSVESWLKETSYPLWRQEELLEKWRACQGLLREEHLTCAAHGKDEGYPLPKHLRIINARPDEFKCLMGPYFKQLEKVVFCDERAIKHVPPSERPKRLMELAPYPIKFTGDYSSFEASVKQDVMMELEFPLYRWMFKHLPGWLIELAEFVFGGWNKTVHGTRTSRWFVLWCIAVRMSGDMQTSLGNWWLNLVVTSYLTARAAIGARGDRTLSEYAKALHKFTVEGMKCVFEGDDGLVGTSGPAPTPADALCLGFVLKMVVSQTISQTDFCGLMFDENDLVNIVDPRKVLGNFGWTSSRWLKCTPKTAAILLRAKAFSFAYLCPGCPIVSALAQYGLRVTRAVPMCKMWWRWKQRDMNEFEREWLKSVLEAGEVAPVRPPMRTRLLMYDRFGITVVQQIAIERYLDSLTSIEPLALPLDLFPSEWVEYWNAYVCAPANHRRPYICPPQLRDVSSRWVRVVDAVPNGSMAIVLKVAVGGSGSA